VKLSIRSKLIFYTFCIAFLVGGGISIYSIYLDRARLLSAFEQSSREIAGLLAETIFDDLYFSNLQSLRMPLKSARVNPDVKYTKQLQSGGYDQGKVVVVRSVSEIANLLKQGKAGKLIDAEFGLN
jgi:hypothetical protein